MELAHLNEHGVPPVRRESFPEAPVVVLERLLASVEPGDLSPQAGALWARAGAVYKRHGKLSWPMLESRQPSSVRDEAAWMRNHGVGAIESLGMLGMGVYAPRAARKLLELAQAERAFDRAQTDAVAAVEAARESMYGV
jgi:hypothetical protein